MNTLQPSLQRDQDLNFERNISTHHAFLATKRISHVLAKVKPATSKRPLVDLPITATIEQALSLLSSEDTLSVPVYRLDGAEQTKVYVAIVNVLDLMKLFNQQQQLTDSLFFQQSLEDAIEQTSPSERLVTVQASDALLDVIALLTRQNTHQVLVTNEQRQPPILLSQMDLLRYLQAHNHHLGPILDLTVPRLVQLDSQQARPTFNTATYKITAFSAFQQLARDAGIGALPIVDDEGYLVNDLGPQDLQGIDKSRFQELKKPILMFLKSNRRDLVVTPFTCHERFTLSQIMSALVLGKTSRLWWIGQDGHIKDVITPTNVLCAFITLH